MFNSLTPPPVSSYGASLLSPAPPQSGGPQYGGQKVSTYTSPWTLTTGRSHSPRGPSSIPFVFHIQRIEVLCHMGLGLTWSFKMDCMCPSFPCPIPACISFLGLPGLPFCHQATLMPGPHSYGPAREANPAAQRVRPQATCLSLSAPLGFVLRESVGGQGIYLGKGNA